MDTARFGRALGMGARGAAKAVLAAADAATAKPASAAQPLRPSIDIVRTIKQLHETQAGVTRGSRRFGETVWRPFVRLGGVLWLELTGVFFGLFVLFAGGNAWKLRANLHETAANRVEHQHLFWSLAMAALFGYFCLSSFMRANRRSHGR